MVRSNPEAGSCFPGRDAGDMVGGRVDLGVKVEASGEVGLELGDASQLAKKRESRPAGQTQTKDSGEGSGGLGDDDGGLSLPIFEGSGGAAEDYAPVVFDGEGGESGTDICR